MNEDNKEIKETFKQINYIKEEIARIDIQLKDPWNNKHNKYLFEYRKLLIKRLGRLYDLLKFYYKLRNELR